MGAEAGERERDGVKGIQQPLTSASPALVPRAGNHHNRKSRKAFSKRGYLGKGDLRRCWVGKTESVLHMQGRFGKTWVLLKEKERSKGLG